MMDKIFEVIMSLTDNDTLILFGLFMIAVMSPEHRELIIGATGGYLGSQASMRKN